MTPMARRAFLLGGAGLLAGAAGAGWSWHRHRQQLVAEQANINLWALRFARPEGGELDMATLRGRPLVINFWATWCAPCLKELPQIDRFHRDFKPRGLQVLGLAMDKAEPVREFLGKLPLSFPVALGGLDGSDVAMQFGNLQGVLPFTVLLDAEGKPRWHKIGETRYEELAEQARKL
jgi:thiol-disulfide isomerase/thioredoxin